MAVIIQLRTGENLSRKFAHSNFFHILSYGKGHGRKAVPLLFTKLKYVYFAIVKKLDYKY